MLIHRLSTRVWVYNNRIIYGVCGNNNPGTPWAWGNNRRTATLSSSARHNHNIIRKISATTDDQSPGRRSSVPFSSYPVSESEHTGGVIEDLYNKPTEEVLTKLGFAKPNFHEANFTALCRAISKHPTILAVQRRIPESDIIHLVHQMYKSVENIGEDNAILDSECCQKEAEFIRFCGTNLELDYVTGGYRPRLTTMTEFAAESKDEYRKKTRDYNAIRWAIQDGWSNCTGSNALQAMLLRAISVCDNYRDLIGLPSYDGLLEVVNIGGGSPRWAGAFTCNYAILENQFIITEGDDLPTRVRKEKYIKDSWDSYNEVGSRVYVPDLQVFRKRSSENPYDIEVIATVEITSKRAIGIDQIKQSWNQALCGLQYSRCTYALIMSLYEAKLLKIEILDDESIATSEKNYNFSRDGNIGFDLYQSSAMVELFCDLVQILWKKNKNHA